jgi:ABC-type phosphate/phosphonate transport system substrate-binding protein
MIRCHECGREKIRPTPLSKLILPCLAALAAAALAGPLRADAPPDPVRLGMVRSLFKNVPEPLIKVSMQPFRALMQAQTGYSCELSRPADAFELGEQIAKKEVQLGVFQGIEFAWAKEKYPELQPLVIAVNQHPNRRAFLIVRADGPIHQMADLQGKKLSIPRMTRDHCEVFVSHQCQQLGKPLDQFFSNVNTNLNAEKALDDVVDEKLDAVALDDVAWTCYQRRKPGRSQQLKALLQSEWFPDTVVAYRENYLDQSSLDRFRNGLLTADQNALGRQLLTLWVMTEFRKVPNDFDKLLSEIAKKYPAPPQPAKVTHGNK